MTRLQEIKRRFNFNKERIRNLTQLYASIKNNNHITDARKNDLLRSAVVFMHASLEDVLRECLRRKMSVSENIAGLLSFKSTDGSEVKKISLSDLVQLGNDSVTAIANDALNRFIEQRTFNNTDQLCLALNWMQVDVDPFRQHFSALADSIARRHDIVHRGDRNHRGRLSSIEAVTIAKWFTAHCGFFELLFAAI